VGVERFNTRLTNIFPFHGERSLTEYGSIRTSSSRSPRPVDKENSIGPHCFQVAGAYLVGGYRRPGRARRCHDGADSHRHVGTHRKEAAPDLQSQPAGGPCGIEKGSLSHRLSKSDLPAGKLNESGSRREFSLDEARAWIREYRKEWLRPAGAEAVTISIGNFKGGVSKTTTAVTLAQGLSLLGHRVLVIDTDPRAR
jgi:hypothetical protein